MTEKLEKIKDIRESLAARKIGGTGYQLSSEEHGLVEWDICLNGCWQGPFNSKSECIKHLEECIAEQREEAQEQKG